MRSPRLIPVCQLKGCAAAIEFYKDVLGAKEQDRFDGPDGVVLHAELCFGESVFMMGDSQGSAARPFIVSLAVDDCDGVFHQAVAAGVKVIQEPADQFYGERTARFVDGWGNEWVLTTHVEDVSRAEQKRLNSSHGYISYAVFCLK